MGESTDPIGRTRLIQLMHPSYPGANGMTYTNAPPHNCMTVMWWYTSVASRLYIRTGPWDGSASHTARRMQGKDLPNCSNSGAASLLVVSFTLVMCSCGFSDRLRIRRGTQCACGTAVISESFSLSPNSFTASNTQRIMLKPSLILLCIYPRTNVVISGVQDEVLVLLKMAVSIAWGDYRFWYRR